MKVFVLPNHESFELLYSTTLDISTEKLQYTAHSLRTYICFSLTKGAQNVKLCTPHISSTPCNLTCTPSSPVHHPHLQCTVWYTNLTCTPTSPVHQPHLYIMQPHLYTNLTCTPTSPVHQPHLYINLTCTPISVYQSQWHSLTHTWQLNGEIKDKIIPSKEIYNTR